MSVKFHGLLEMKIIDVGKLNDDTILYNSATYCDLNSDVQVSAG